MRYKQRRKFTTNEVCSILKSKLFYETTCIVFRGGRYRSHRLAVCNTSVDTSPVTHDDTSPVTPDDTTDYSAMLGGMSLQEYAACDDDIETRLDEISTPATTPSENTAATADGDEQEAGDDHEVPHPPITKLKALSHLRELEIFFLQQNVPHLRDAIVKIQSDTLARNPTTSKQTTLTNFFKRT